MKTLEELYKEDPTVASNFLDSLNMQILPLMDDISLQVYYNMNTKKYEFHTHSPEIAIGPKISRLTKIFCQDISDAITLIKSKHEVVNAYRFLNLSIYNKEIYLLSFMLMGDTKIVDDYESLFAVANMLGIKVSPVLFAGRLSKSQQDSLKSYLLMIPKLDSTQFKDTFKSIIFDPKNPNAKYDNINDYFDNTDYINGLVFSVNFGDKIAKYVIKDKQTEERNEEETARKKLNKLQHKGDYAVLIKCMIDWLILKASRMDDKHMASLEKNFVEMCKNDKVLMKLLQVAAKLPIRTDSRFMLQTGMLSNDIQQLLRKHGTPMRTLVEQYLLTFYKHKNIYFGIEADEKEVIENIEKIIDII